MIVRRATAQDVEAMAQVAERAYRAAFRDILEEDVLAQRNVGFFAARFAEDLQHMRVVVEDEQVLGFTLVIDGHIEMIFVDPAWIGTGAGSRLLAQAESEGARSLECFRDNLPARRFYESRGWSRVRQYRRKFLGRVRAFVAYEKG